MVLSIGLYVRDILIKKTLLMLRFTLCCLTFLLPYKAAPDN
jgi:hypothetical protein